MEALDYKRVWQTAVDKAGEVFRTGMNRKKPHLTINKEEVLVGDKAIREDAVASMTVTTASGKTFDANQEARINMIAAIDASAFLGLVEKKWRLADNTEPIVTLFEIREASALALEKYGNIIGV